MALLRLIFMGTAGLASVSLEALARQPNFTVVSVVTQPDRPRGRDLKLQPPPVKQAAARLGLPVVQPERAREENFLRQLEVLEPDLIAVAAYGQILPKAILELPRFGCLNVHTSLLPKYRGAAPIQWAILEDEPETGVTIMKMDVGLDTGDILAQVVTPISQEDNAQTLEERLSRLGAELLATTIQDHVAGKTLPHPQPPQGATYARKLTKEDGRLDWTQPARALWNRVRALVPWPGAYTHLPGQSQTLKIWRVEMVETKREPGEIIESGKSGLVVACGLGGLRILELQREGGRRMTAEQFMAGHQFQAGARFS